MVDHWPLKPWQPAYLDLLEKLEEAVDRWPQFDAPDDEEESVTGSALVDWFAGWCKETKAMVFIARAECEGVAKTSIEEETAALRNSLAEARALVSLLVEAWPRPGRSSPTA